MITDSPDGYLNNTEVLLVGDPLGTRGCFVEEKYWSSCHAPEKK